MEFIRVGLESNCLSNDSFVRNGRLPQKSCMMDRYGVHKVHISTTSVQIVRCLIISVNYRMPDCLIEELWTIQRVNAEYDRNDRSTNSSLAIVKF